MGTALKPQISTLTVTTAGTRVQVTAATTQAVWVRFESIAGTIYVGGSTVASTLYMAKLTAGNGITIDLSALAGKTMSGISLASFYLDAVGSGDKCQVTYFERAGTV